MGNVSHAPEQGILFFHSCGRLVRAALKVLSGGWTALPPALSKTDGKKLAKERKLI